MAFKKFRRDATDYTYGLVTLGVGSAIGAGLAAKGGADLGGSFSTAASFAGIGAVGLGAGAALRSVQNIQKAEHKYSDYKTASMAQRKFKKRYGYKPSIFKVTHPKTKKSNYVIVKPSGLKEIGGY